MDAFKFSILQTIVSFCAPNSYTFYFPCFTVSVKTSSMWLSKSNTYFFKFFFIYFDCSGSSLLCGLFSSCREWDSHCGKIENHSVQSCLTLCNPMDYTGHGTLQARILKWVAFPSLLQGIFPTQGLDPAPPHCRGFFTSWATGKPKNTGVGSLSFLQGIFQTTQSNRGPLHCRRIFFFFTNWATGKPIAVAALTGAQALGHVGFSRCGRETQ